MIAVPDPVVRQQRCRLSTFTRGRPVPTTTTTDPFLRVPVAHEPPSTRYPMIYVIPPHAPLESNEDKREAVRRRAASTVVSLAALLFVSLLVALLTCPWPVSVALVTFGVGFVVGRRL